MKNKIIPAFILFMSAAVNLSAVETGGFTDCYFSGRIDNGELIGSRTRLRYNIESEMDESYIFASLNVYENMISDEKKIDLHEIYMEYSSELWSMRLGKQLHIWGKADGIRITDILNPCDYSEYNTLELDDMRIPVESVKINYFPGNMNIELIWIPVFRESIYPEKDSVWDNGTMNSNISAPEVKQGIKNSEIGFRVMYYFTGIDAAVSAFHTRDDDPLYKYHTLDFIGLEFSKPAGDFVIRNENAFYFNKHFFTETEKTSSENKYLKNMIGIDWYGDGGFTILLQYGTEYIIDYSDDISSEEFMHFTTLNISKKLLRETLEISNMVYFNITDEDGYNRFSTEYMLTDNFSLTGGTDIFFDTFSNNRSVWVKGKYSF